MTNDLLTCLAVDICPVLFVEWTPERGGMGKAEEKREQGVGGRRREEREVWRGWRRGERGRK